MVLTLKRWKSRTPPGIAAGGQQGITHSHCYRKAAAGKPSGGFFVFEPSFQGHANLTRWLRLTLNTSYRMVHGVDYKGLNERDLRGFSVGGALQVGWF